MTSESEGHDDAGVEESLHAQGGMEIESRFAQCFLNAIAIPSPTVMEELREVTWLLAETMRSDGIRPERALIVLKALLRDPAMEMWKPSLGGSESRMGASTRIYTQLFDWWLTAYFAKPSDPGSPDGQATADSQ